jgi:hypothetical protein
MAKERGEVIWSRYVTLPELSVEGFQAIVAVVWVMAVVCRLVGVVGAVSGAGVVTVNVLLFADRFPALSTAYT